MHRKIASNFSRQQIFETLHKIEELKKQTKRSHEARFVIGPHDLLLHKK